MLKQLYLICLLNLLLTTAFAQQHYNEQNGKITLTAPGASHLATLPLKCIDQQFPHNPWYIMLDTTFVTKPINLHPSFYGCFDWHSSVHGHWLLVSLLKQYPTLPEADSIKRILKAHLSAANMQKEAAIFTGSNKTFERIYGWGWLLQRQSELLTWNDPLGKELSTNVDTMARQLSRIWVPFLNKLVYPVREPEHYNLAFGLCLSWDYALTAKDTALQNAIKKAALRFYTYDINCPTGYEPGGYDFFSPCLEEADLMQRILPAPEFNTWLKNFMPQLYTNPANLFTVGDVVDPTDGKLIHLYGLNLSRAWCLYNIAAKMPEANAKPVRELATQHLKYSLPHVVTNEYMGDHWLATYVAYAIQHVK
jgi:hypothetical protein